MYYDIYRTLRAELVKEGVDVPEAPVTGLLISRRLISIIREGDTRINILREYDGYRTVLNKERREQHESIVDSESEVGLQPSTSTRPPLTSSYPESVSTPTTQRIHQQQQEPPRLSPALHSPAAPELGRINRATTYPDENYGPNFIPLEQQVLILQCLSQIPQPTPPAMMYPNHMPFPFIAPATQQNIATTLPIYCPGATPEWSNIAAYPQPLGWQWANQGIMPMWQGVNQVPPVDNGEQTNQIASQEHTQTTKVKKIMRMRRLFSTVGRKRMRDIDYAFKQIQTQKTALVLPRTPSTLSEACQE